MSKNDSRPRHNISYEWHGSLSPENERKVQSLCRASGNLVKLVDNDQTVQMSGPPGPAFREIRRFVDRTLSPCTECMPGEPCWSTQVRMRGAGGLYANTEATVAVQIRCDGDACEAKVELQDRGLDAYWLSRHLEERLDRQLLKANWAIFCNGLRGPSEYLCPRCRHAQR